MKYSEAAYMAFRILEKIEECKSSIPQDCYREIERECLVFLDKLYKAYLNNEADGV